MWVTGALYLETKSALCLFPAFELLIRVTLCSLPMWFPTKLLHGYCRGYHIYRRQGLENTSEGDGLGADDERGLSG